VPKYDPANLEQYDAYHWLNRHGLLLDGREYSLEGHILIFIKDLMTHSKISGLSHIFE